MNDLRYALRSLGKSPLFTLATVLTLALGIGSATSIFSAAERVLFRPPPYPAPEQLVVLGNRQKAGQFLNFLFPPQLQACREQAESYQSLAACVRSSVNLVVGNEPMGVNLSRVSAEYFAMLGAIPLHGRGFVPGEDRSGFDQVIVLGHRFWRERFGGDPAAVGRDVRLAGESCRVIGVLPPDFRPAPGGAADVYRPLVPPVDPTKPGRVLTVIGRLHPGVSPEQAQAELSTIQFPSSVNLARLLETQGMRMQLQPLKDASQAPTWTASNWAMLAAVGLLYAIAAANAANLMLARLHGRRREFSVRLALGGSRGRLMWLVATENLLLTTLAGLAGLLVALWVFPLLLQLASDADRIWIGPAKLNWRALAFTAGLSVVTGWLVSLPAAWGIARAKMAEGLKEDVQTVGASRRLRRLRNGLVLAEAALAVVLLVGAGLMVRTVQRLQHIDYGFDPANKASVWIQLAEIGSANRYQDPAAYRQFYADLDERLRLVPGVQGVAMTSTLPLVGRSIGTLKRPDGSELDVAHDPVSPGYLRALGLRMRKGRWFADAVLGDAPVVVINETLARAYFGETDPIGQSMVIGSGRRAVPWQVIGVVADVREAAREAPRPHYYCPYWQEANPRSVTLLLRLNRPADAALNEAVRRAVFTVDPLAATMSVSPLDDAADGQIYLERFLLSVLQVLSALALGLAVAGLFAVMLYTVTQRMGEFGVRLAFGATPEHLFRLVLRHGLILAATGTLLGFGAAAMLTRYLRSLLYETSAYDPLVYATVALLLLAAAALGCWLPARRATRVDVAKLLRAE